MRVTKRLHGLPIVIVGLLILLTVGPGASARDIVQSVDQQQSTPCNAARSVVNAALGACTELNTNYVCYGTVQSEAAPPEERFYAPKDRLPIEVVKNVRTAKSPPGAAVMNLQLASEDDPITALLFGDGTLSGAGSNAFRLEINDGQLVCQATPPGLTVRTQQGQRARIRINNVDIILESVAFITMRDDTEMIVVNLQGNVAVSSDALGVIRQLPVGQQVLITEVNGQPVNIGLPQPSPYAASSLLQYVAGPSGLARVFDPSMQPARLPPCGGEISIGEVFASANFAPGQECLFTFCANAGDVVTINMDRIGGQLDPYIDLRAPDQQLILWNDNISPSNRNSMICNQPLAETSCNYTIVARPRSNDSRGSFALTLQAANDCVRPQERCDVSTRYGLSLRAGPGDQYRSVATLRQGAQLEPLQWNEDNSWVGVQVMATGQLGWVDTNYVYCDTPREQTPPEIVTPVPPPTVTPQPPPHEEETTPVPTKLSPYPLP